MDIILSPRNLYRQMELEREEDTTETRKDFLPFFVAKLIRDKLRFFPQTEASAFLLDEDAKVVVNKILHFGQLASATIGLKRNDFCKHFCEHVPTPSLELIWLLDVKYHLMTITSYIMELTLRGDTSAFREQFLSFCSCSYLLEHKTRGSCLDIFEKLLEAIIITSLCTNTNDALLIKLKSFSSDLLRAITSWFIKERPDLEDVQKFLLAEMESLPLPVTTKAQYFTEQLCSILTEPAKLSTDQVIQQQEALSSPSGNNSKVQMIKVLINDPQKPLETLRLIVKLIIQRSGQLNWENTLLTITLWQKMYDDELEGVRYFKDQIKALMFDGISQNNQDKMTSSFILARHCSLISPATFFRYETWYKYMFEHDQFSPIKDASSFTFFTKFLTDWISFEPPCFLQVQATYWPHIPTGCKTLWNDYISLAKARVQEYNEVECIMELETGPTTVDPAIQNLVESSVKHFQQTNKISTAIVSLSFMERRKFIDKFLPALFKKPVGVSRSDARLRLIEHLNATQKIPPQLYAKYKKGEFN